MAIGVCDSCGATGQVEAMGKDAAGEPDSPDMCETCRGSIGEVPKTDWYVEAHAALSAERREEDPEQEEDPDQDDVYSDAEMNLRSDPLGLILQVYGNESHRSKPKSLVCVTRLSVTRNESIVEARVVCNDGIVRKCRASAWSTPSGREQPADSGEDFEWIEEAK